MFFEKLLPVFFYPLGIAIGLGVVALLVWRMRRTSRLFVTVAVIVLWVASAPVFANWLVARLEAVHPPVPIDQLPDADVAIILGGVVAQRMPQRAEPDLGDPVDRIVHAWRLFRSGKVGGIVVSGGNLPWQTATEPEATLVRRFLVELGVPERSIIVETDSRNTHENAINTAEIFQERGWRSSLLVTSGAHMPRAIAAFRRAGLPAIPAATDIRGRYPLADSVLDFLPDAGALGLTTTAIREWIGLQYYRWKGWA